MLWCRWLRWLQASALKTDVKQYEAFLMFSQTQNHNKSTSIHDVQFTRSVKCLNNPLQKNPSVLILVWWKEVVSLAKVSSSTSKLSLLCHFIFSYMFWGHLWYFTRHTHSNMESICQLFLPSRNESSKKWK